MSADEAKSRDKGVTIQILGREFRVACPEGEEKQLQASVEFVNRRMKDLRDNGKVTGNERIAIMAALNITHEFLSTRVEGGFDVGEFKRRISGMQAAIDQALNGQDELF